MKTAKFLLVFAACAVLYRVFEPVYQAETPYSRSESPLMQYSSSPWKTQFNCSSLCQWKGVESLAA